MAFKVLLLIILTRIYISIDCSENQQDFFNAMGFLYTATLVIGVKNCGSVQPQVGIERVVFYRERAAGMYSALAYAVSQASIELVLFT